MRKDEKNLMGSARLSGYMITACKYLKGINSGEGEKLAQGKETDPGIMGGISRREDGAGPALARVWPMGGSFPLRGQEKMNHRRCCGFLIYSRREKGAWLSTSRVWDLVGGC